jgi:hypothetical protein
MQENWENDLNKLSHHENLHHELGKMLDTIDEVYDAYWDYYKTEGDDGVFARENYLYLLKFEELQKEIVQWRPEHIYDIWINPQKDRLEVVIVGKSKYTKLSKRDSKTLYGIISGINLGE